MLTLARRLSSSLTVAVAVSALAVTAGCSKKVASAPPPPPPAAVAAPTADLSATPNTVNPGDTVALVWHTQNATNVSIDGIGEVSSSGTQSVRPTESTTYHLVARNDGGSTDASARVTVGSGNVSAAPPSNIQSSDVSDSLFHQDVKDVFFDYDSYELNGPAQTVVTADTAFLAQHPNLKIVLGGYCDDRGSVEYNLALGENRANATKQALVAQGIAADRIRTVSYGKEKQFCTEEDESCYQQNRRAQFEVDR